jgi:predicted adenylyl cyclase CyaB
MKETEVKILEVNKAKVFDGDIKTLFFDFKKGTIIRQKNVLRLRKEQDKTELTYKKVYFTPSTKTAEEYSVEVSSLETMEKILENLGLSIIESMQKHRVSYTIDDARFDFDRYFGRYGFIPEFLEIEANNTDLIYKYAALLGFKRKDCLPWSTTELINHYFSK